MAQPATFAPRTTRSRKFSVVGLALLLGGLMGHVLAAQAIGGTRLAYRDQRAYSLELIRRLARSLQYSARRRRGEKPG